MIAALHLSGKSERTPASSVREVHLLAQFYHKSPDRISEQELQHYFLHCKNVDGLAPASIRFFYYPRCVEAGRAVHARLTPAFPGPQPVCNSMDDAVASGSLLEDGIYSTTS
jgi:hypothetical protein